MCSGAPSEPFRAAARVPFAQMPGGSSSQELAVGAGREKVGGWEGGAGAAVGPLEGPGGREDESGAGGGGDGAGIGSASERWMVRRTVVSLTARAGRRHIPACRDNNRSDAMMRLQYCHYGTVMEPYPEVEMASLTVKGVPAELLDRLKAAAAAERRSLNGEVIVRLERSLAEQPRADAEELLRRVDAVRACVAGPLPTDAEIRAARDDGRR